LTQDAVLSDEGFDALLELVIRPSRGWLVDTPATVATVTMADTGKTGNSSRKVIKLVAGTIRFRF